MRHCCLLVAVFFTCVASPAMAANPAAKHKKPPAAENPAAPPPPVVATLPDPPTPVTQALGLGMDTCAPVLSAMSHETLTSAYDVQSGWHRADPAHHVFQTVAGLKTPANTPPDSFVALIAAPGSASGCDGVSVQVLPLAGTCETAQKVLETNGKRLGALLGSQIMVDGAGKRLILLPGAANTSPTPTTWR
jgi:hypothetical protein